MRDVLVKRLLLAALSASLFLAACGREAPPAPTGKACLGANADTLVENLGGQCQAGDAIATKHPSYFCDFRYAIAYNSYNSALCIYTGKQAEERIPK